jgi:hypothetical protein
MAPWWWFLRKPKHVGATVGILIVLIFLWFYDCVYHRGTIKSGLILLMHGTNMKNMKVHTLFQTLTFSVCNPTPCWWVLSCRNLSTQSALTVTSWLKWEPNIKYTGNFYLQYVLYHTKWKLSKTCVLLYVEIKRPPKCATDGSLMQNLLFAQHVSGTIMPIVRSSRVWYR